MTAEQINQMGSYAAFAVLGILLIAVIVAVIVSPRGGKRRGASRRYGSSSRPLVDTHGIRMMSVDIHDTGSYESSQDPLVNSDFLELSVGTFGLSQGTDVNTNGTPMISGGAVDIHGDAYGSCS